MNFIYWNTKNNDVIDIIIEILEEEKPELFFLSEITKYPLSIHVEKLIQTGYNIFENPGCKRVMILKKDSVNIDLGLQNKYYTTISYINTDLFVVSLHLPSQMFQHMESLKEFIRDFRVDLDNTLGDSLETKILIIGDFNVNPYESPMIDYDGFRAINSPNGRKVINHLTKSKTSYYNPTWQLYAHNKFPGTKFFPRPSSSSYDVLEFHFLDQVVISHKLLESISEEKIKVIERTSNFVLFDEGKNLIRVSDHLPLSYKIKMK